MFHCQSITADLQLPSARGQLGKGLEIHIIVVVIVVVVVVVVVVVIRQP